MNYSATVLLLSLTCAANASSAAWSDNPEAYWNRGYGCSQAAENYNITLKVDDIDVMAGKVDAVMTAAGAPSQLGNNSTGSMNDGSGTVRYRQMNYSLPSKAAEKLTKKLMDMGELINYSLNRQNATDTVKQLEERILALEGELKENEGLLLKMPAAAYFLRSKLNSLKQTRESCLAGVSKSAISISLRGKPAGAKP